MQIAMVYVTCPDQASAQRIARDLLARRLIACANLHPAGTIYRWEGSVLEEDEHVLILKTRDDLASTVMREVAALHPYEVPCIVAYPSMDAHGPYRDWVASETG
jgi:periplasmic divalent cation tolerance protein